MIAATPTIFLDRDGVLNRRIVDDYVTSVAELEILPGVPEALALLSKLGFRLVVVTNQRGIAIGRMTLEDVSGVHAFLSAEAAGAGARLEEFYVCPHDRDEGCACRKPAPGLLDQAHQREPVAREQSWLIGDSDSDILAGKARGVRTIKVAGPGKAGADFNLPDLPAAAAMISVFPGC